MTGLWNDGFWCRDICSLEEVLLGINVGWLDRLVKDLYGGLSGKGLMEDWWAWAWGWGWGDVDFGVFYWVLLNDLEKGDIGWMKFGYLMVLCMMI